MREKAGHHGERKQSNFHQVGEKLKLQTNSELLIARNAILDKYNIIPAYPATGILYKINGFLSGHVRLRGRGRGAYPFKYLEMIKNVFYESNKTIEVCSGSIIGDSKIFTVDINPDCNPDMVADGQQLSEIPDNTFSRWRCDPPYNEKSAFKMYNTELPQLSKLLKAGARIIKPGSLMFLLCSQNFQWCPVNVKRIGIITMTIVPNNELRACNIYIKSKTMAKIRLGHNKIEIDVL